RPRRCGRSAGTAIDRLSAPGGDCRSPSGLREGPPMEEWIEEDMTLLSHTDEKAPRVLDQRMIREPIRYLEPRSPVALPPSATVQDAIRTMREHRIGCLLVVDDARLVGIITERDLLLKLGDGDLGRPVRELMTPDPEVLTPEDPI